MDDADRDKIINLLCNNSIHLANMEEILAYLEDKYKKPETPLCVVCGRKLKVLEVGGGPTVYACSTWEEDPSNPDQLIRRQDYADYDMPYWDHYAASRFVDYSRGGDHLVLELIDRVRKGNLK